jgi:uncharacterized protein (DUF4415 family)
MSEEATGSTSALEQGTDWEKLRQMTDVEVHAALESDPEIVPTDENFWLSAEVVLPRRKVVVTMRLDADLLEWFRQEKGYQTKINAILRTYMAEHLARDQRSQQRRLDRQIR